MCTAGLIDVKRKRDTESEMKQIVRFCIEAKIFGYWIEQAKEMSSRGLLETEFPKHTF
jgi:hypothetical protein